LQTKPDAKIGILYQNDDYGKDYLKGIKDGLGDKAVKMIVSEASYEVTDPTVDSQIVTHKGSGADVFFNITMPKFAAQAIRRAYDIDLAPAAIPQQRLCLGRLGADPGRAGEIGRPRHRCLFEGSGWRSITRRATSRTPSMSTAIRWR
jgi:hypothetical protein